MRSISADVGSTTSLVYLTKNPYTQALEDPITQSVVAYGDTITVPLMEFKLATGIYMVSISPAEVECFTITLTAEYGDTGDHVRHLYFLNAVTADSGSGGVGGTPLPATAVECAYTSQDEIKRLFSECGIDLSYDDATTAEKADILTEAISYATEYIDQYIYPFYDPTLSCTSHWVRRRATFLAAWYLSQRRGNPSLFSDMVLKIDQELEMVKNGSIMIPRIAARYVRGPSLSNYLIDDLRHYQNKHRKQKSLSVGESYPEEMPAREPSSPYL